ncbi:MAG: hypothetical protein ACD_78C00349G0003 [uncultured bacterium (gcode 4)]|uniref:Uncharacterized protein n=1 Tax=uncultured bacterium (gcode 4) TaxID=1234023 RepID=K1YWE9_9BACT|nr:MAG: hypothetical protein ACD_78C00349G0003 [uncultured bacterium (gcode 4)]
MHGYEIDTRSIVSDEVRGRNLDVILFHETDEFPIIKEREIPTPLLESSYRFDEFTEIYKVTSIERTVGKLVLRAKVIIIDWRNIFLLPSGEHINLNQIFGRILIVLVGNPQGVCSGNEIDQIFQSRMVGKDREFDEEIGKIPQIGIGVSTKSINPRFSEGKPWKTRSLNSNIRFLVRRTFQVYASLRYSIFAQITSFLRVFSWRSAIVDFFWNLPNRETMNVKTRMSENGKEDLIPRVSPASERYEIFENLVHEPDFLGIEYILVSTQCHRNAFRKQNFRKIFKGFVFLRNNCNFIGKNTRFDGFRNIVRYPNKLLRLIFKNLLYHFSSRTAMRMKRFRRVRKNIADGMNRSVHNLPRNLNNLAVGTIIGLEDDKLSIRPTIPEKSNVFRIGSLKLVDGLIVISDSEYVRTLAHFEDVRDEAHLCIIRVLIFVDEDELVLLGKIRPNIRVFFDELNRRENHIGKIYIPPFFHSVLVELIDSRQGFIFIETRTIFQNIFSLMILFEPFIAPFGGNFRICFAFLRFPGFHQALKEHIRKAHVHSVIFRK